ncbi:MULTISPECIES: hypothetical protein [unclassified Pseudonocardia]|uniref:hypothetical protein n=1 Tax=unclassified Pseudonocardia TaxID=2619320 RepID=UPI001115471E|nr:hypothetical protein [Pseudonocardia sp. Ae707_Ps1]
MYAMVLPGLFSRRGRAILFPLSAEKGPDRPRGNGVHVTDFMIGHAGHRMDVQDQAVSERGSIVRNWGW